MGIDVERAAAAWINPDTAAFPTDAERSEYYARLLASVRSQRGIEAAGAVDFPFHFDRESTVVRLAAAPRTRQPPERCRARRHPGISRPAAYGSFKVAGLMIAIALVHLRLSLSAKPLRRRCRRTTTPSDNPCWWTRTIRRRAQP